MSSVNKVLVLGRLGRDPDFRTTSKGTPVCTLSVATDFKPKDGEPITEWHRIVCWGRSAEIASKYLSKGRQVHIDGRLQTRAWEDKEGDKRYTTEIVCERLTLVGKGDGDGAGAKLDQVWNDNYQPAGSDEDIPF